MWYSVRWDNLLISTLYSVVQVDDSVKCILIVQVKIMDISCQAGSESNGQFRLKVTNLGTMDTLRKHECYSQSNQPSVIYFRYLPYYLYK